MPPEVKFSPRNNITAFEGESLIMNIMTTGRDLNNQLPSVEWLKDGWPIEFVLVKKIFDFILRRFYS